MDSVLVVDDEVVILEMLRHALVKYGCVVETATSGEEGIQKFDGGAFDVVITDVCMPGIGGVEFLDHIRSSSRKATAAIGISGTPWLLEGSGFDSILPKPFSLQILFDTLDGFLDGACTRAASA